MTTKQKRLLAESLRELGRIYQYPQLQNLKEQILEAFEESETATCEEIGSKLAQTIINSNYLQLSRESIATLNTFWVNAIKEITK